VAHEVLADGLGWQNAAGNVLGVYLHGLFEDANVIGALFGRHAAVLDEVFDRLADSVAQAVLPGWLSAQVDIRAAVDEGQGDPQ
jgi:adenosylcobyric acid synthase